MLNWLTHDEFFFLGTSGTVDMFRFFFCFLLPVKIFYLFYLEDLMF
jgi:hypothetical protein